MIHPASRLEVILHSRADGRSAVKSAAYTARTTYRDARVGRRFSSGRKGGLLSHELFNWAGDAEALWTAAERSERRKNARVIRELRPALPRELPLPEQVRLVRSFSLWLRDEYGVAIQADIHAPRFLCPKEEKLHSSGKLGLMQQDYERRIFDPSKTNQNFHAHILMTTRTVDRDTGVFGEKTRVLDDRTSGPAEIKRIRGEWEKRTNAALRKIGSSARVDLRSYAEMAKAGDAPEGLMRQYHVGPRRSARSRRKVQETGQDDTVAGSRRQAAQEHNATLWSSWLQLRALERQKDDREAERIAQTREADRRKTAAAEKRRLQGARTAGEARAALEDASQLESLKTGPSALQQAIRWALEGRDDPPCEAEAEFSAELDLETWQPPSSPKKDPVLEVRRERVRKPRQRHR
ncbi:MobA/MobL family protein [Ruegeria arenilitoris]|uniref:MobA/MobL family protein n=1 Tax=Ruegeria arenilitoris TaxID=1173585 RepID=UPI00147F830E|nr:MobA/MobL family protein [Ruegeria arenilitoris]